MGKKNNADINRQTIINYIKKNPTATYRSIKRSTKLHTNRYFGSLSEAYNLAGVKQPRKMKRKNREERRTLITEYIKNNPGCTQEEITLHTNAKIHDSFKNIREAYKEANVTYSRNKPCPGWSLTNSKKEKQKVIGLLKTNPYLTAKEISDQLKINNIFYLFKNFNEIYSQAGLKPISVGAKIRYQNQRKVVDYIKKNPFATQREINRNCKTHVQELFEDGIFGAYQEANVNFPYERLRFYGVGLENIRKRAKSFEEDIARKLSGFGSVNRLVKTKRGIADILFERKDKKVVIEVKDYRKKEISISQVKQLNKYLDDFGINVGILVCHNKPKRDRFIMGNNKIFIIEKQDLKRIPVILEGL